jgi:hypothetical protein
LERRRPIILQHIKAYATEPVDIGMIDFGKESYPWWTHRIVIGQEEFEFEDATCVVLQRQHKATQLLLSISPS